MFCPSAGQTFSDDDCQILGEPAFEEIHVYDGTLNITLAASEAVLIYL
jgi:hypothetical protein